MAIATNYRSNPRTMWFKDQTFDNPKVGDLKMIDVQLNRSPLLTDWHQKIDQIRVIGVRNSNRFVSRDDVNCGIIS